MPILTRPVCKRVSTLFLGQPLISSDIQFKNLSFAIESLFKCQRPVKPCDPRWPSSRVRFTAANKKEEWSAERRKRERERRRKRNKEERGSSTERENWLVARKYQRLIQPDCIRSCDDFTNAVKTAGQTHFPFREFFPAITIGDERKRS